MRNIIVSVCALIISCLTPAAILSRKSSNKTKEDKTMNLKELYDAFVKDENAAMKMYVGQMVEIKGHVTYVGPDVYGLPSIELSEQKGGKALAACILPTLDYLKLRKYSKDDQLIIKGRIHDFWREGSQVVIKESKVLKKL